MTQDNGLDVSPSWQELKDERDALAAHVDAGHRIVHEWKGDAQASLQFYEWMSTKPKASLERLKAEWAAEGAQAAADSIRMDYEGRMHAEDIADFVEDVADDYRCQAKEATCDT